MGVSLSGQSSWWSLKLRAKSAITQQRLALNRSQFAHTYTPTQASPDAGWNPAINVRTITSSTTTSRRRWLKNEEISKLAGKKCRYNSLIFTLDVYSNNLISSWVFLMISVGDLLYNQQERPPKSAQCTTHYLIRVMMHAPYRTLATWISPLSLSLSLLLLLRPAIRDNTSSNHVFSTELLNWSIDCSRRHFFLKDLFLKFLMHDLLHELDTRVYSAVRIRYCVWDYERFVWRAIWPELIHIHIMMSQDLHIWLEQWDHCSQFFFSFWDGCSYRAQTNARLT